MQMATTSVSSSIAETNQADNHSNRSIPVIATPTLDEIPNPPPIPEDADVQFVPLSGIGTGGLGDIETLTVTATSNNPDLIPDPVVQFSNQSGLGSLAYVPRPNAFGTVQITVTVSAGAHATNISRTFTVVVNAENDLPTLDAIADPPPNVLDPCSGVIQLSGIGSGAANEQQTITVTAVSDDPSLIP